VCRTFEQSPLVGIFQAGYAELNTQLKQAAQEMNSPGATPGRPTLKSLAAVDRALLRASAVEVAKLERRLPLLATTASITPFIGCSGPCGHHDVVPGHRERRPTSRRWRRDR
jgi:biopolymer transport protein TolQ